MHNEGPRGYMCRKVFSLQCLAVPLYKGVSEAGGNICAVLYFLNPTQSVIQLRITHY